MTAAMANLEEIFSLIDIENKGYITEKDLRNTGGIDGSIDDIINLLNIKKEGERLTLHQFCQRIHGIHYSPSHYDEEIFEGHGEIGTNINQKLHRTNESNLTVSEISDSTLKQIFTLLKELKDEHDMKNRIEILESEKSNLLRRFEITLERADGLEKQLHDTQDLVKSSRQDLITLQRNFETVTSLVADLKSERKSLQYKLDLLTQEGHANTASLDLQRELLHQDRLAFTLERIAFDNQSKATAVKALEAANTGQKCADVEAAPCCNKSSLIKKALSDSKKHTLSNRLTRLTAEGQTRTSSHDESKEIEDDLTCDEENKENSIMSQERRGSIPLGATSHLVKKAFYIPSPRFNRTIRMTKTDSNKQWSEAFD